MKTQEENISTKPTLNIDDLNHIGQLAKDFEQIYSNRNNELLRKLQSLSPEDILEVLGWFYIKAGDDLDVELAQAISNEICELCKKHHLLPVSQDW
jgi:hypothetical protein